MSEKSASSSAVSRFPTAITASLVGLGVLLPATQPWQGWSLPAEPELQPLMVEGQQANPADFSPEELQELQRRFGVHGPQPALAQLFTAGLDQWQPLRRNTLEQIESLVPTIRREAGNAPSTRCCWGPSFTTKFNMPSQAKTPRLAHSGLLQTHGPAQLGVEELIHQGLLPAEPTPEQRQQAREQLLDPQRNVALLAGKMARLSTALGIPSGHLWRPATATAMPIGSPPWPTCTTANSITRRGSWATCKTQRCMP